MEETGAHIDEDTETTPLSDINSTATLWTIADVTQSVTHPEHNNESTTTINEHDLNNQAKYETGIIENTKKKKSQKPRKTPSKYHSILFSLWMYYKFYSDIFIMKIDIFNKLNTNLILQMMKCRVHNVIDRFTIKIVWFII